MKFILERKGEVLEGDFDLFGREAFTHPLGGTGHEDGVGFDEAFGVRQSRDLDIEEGVPGFEFHRDVEPETEAVLGVVEILDVGGGEIETAFGEPILCVISPSLIEEGSCPRTGG